MGSREAFLTAIKTLNHLKRKGAVTDYAIFGAFAVLRYTEPFATQDLDVLVAVRSAPIINLAPIYDEFKKMGYKWKGQHLIVEGFPIELMVADELELEALSKARGVRVNNIRTKVLTPEYLAALAIRAGRPKDLLKLELLLRQASIRADVLDDILTRYELKAKFERLTRWPEK